MEFHITVTVTHLPSVKFKLQLDNDITVTDFYGDLKVILYIAT